MGQESSRLAEDDIRELESISSCIYHLIISIFLPSNPHLVPLNHAYPPIKVTGEQIKSLYKRFKAMDKDNLGFISENSFLSIPELSMNPLCDRIIRVFNADGHKLVSFKQFVMVLSVFSKKSSLEDKLKCAYIMNVIISSSHVSSTHILNYRQSRLRFTTSMAMA